MSGHGSTERPSKWYRSRRWERLRRHQLARRPFCQCPHHEGRRLRAAHPDYGGAVVDHIEPHRGDPRKFWDPSNLQTMTKQCHDRYKQSAESGGHGFLIGSDEEGMPLDASHPWYG